MSALGGADRRAVIFTDDPGWHGRVLTKALAARGVRAEAMRPSFPSLTFPNHYTLVTGKRPDQDTTITADVQLTVDATVPGCE